MKATCSQKTNARNNHSHCVIIRKAALVASFWPPNGTDLPPGQNQEPPATAMQCRTAARSNNLSIYSPFYHRPLAAAHRAFAAFLASPPIGNESGAGCLNVRWCAATVNPRPVLDSSRRQRRAAESRVVGIWRQRASTVHGPLRSPAERLAARRRDESSCGFSFLLRDGTDDRGRG